MAMVPPPPVLIPHQHSANAPQFDPHKHSTLEVYLADYELAAKAAHLTAADKISQSTRYLEKQEKEDWESFPKFQATPPDWDAFKEALIRDYPDTWKAYMSSEVLEKFIEEKSQQTIWSLAQFSTFNWEFRRIMARLVMEGHSNPEELKKAYTKSTNSDLCQKIQLYLKSEKAPVLKGELYLIEQVREAAKYILKGSDPHF